MSEANKIDDGGFVKAERRPSRFSLKRLLPRTLFARSLLILVTPVILIQVVTMLVFFDRHWTKVTTRLSYAVAGEISLFANMYENDLNRNSAEYVANIVARELSLRASFLPGQTLAQQYRPRNRAVLESVVVKTLKRELRKQLEGRPFVLDFDFDQKTVRVDVQLDGGVLKVTLPERRLFSSSGYVFLLWVFASSFLLLLIAILFMRNQIRPIRKLAVAAKRFGRGRDVPLFKPEGAREVRQASQAFMDMHRRIKRQVSQRTAMLAGVSHDLRTPLTRLKLQAEMTGGEEAEAMKADIDEMERMIDGYLDFVRGEGGEQTRLTDVGAMLEKLCAAARKQGAGAELDIQGDLKAMVRALGFERCLGNIISNALKYGENIWVTAEITDERKLVIMMEDDGPGIPEEQYQDVFRPFYRLDESRNVDSGGVGLGLSIAMDVVNSHGGKILLDNSEAHGGLKVTVRLPV